jgi:hypothetical protein
VKSADDLAVLLRRRLAPALRLAWLLVTVGVVSSAFVLRQARAQVDAAMLGLGSRAMAFPGSPTDPARVVRVNGIEVSLRTQVVKASLSEVLRHYRSACVSADADPGGYSGFFSALATRMASNDDEGYVACVNITVSDLESLAHRLARFSETWDLADVGPLRYVYARPAYGRPARETFVLTMWADTSVDIRGLLPLGDRDANGSDLAGVPRPKDAQRILSAREASEPAGVFVYLTHRTSAAELERDYRRTLPERGWTIVERDRGESVEVNGVRMLSAERAHRMVTLLAHRGDAGRTVVTLLAWEVE